MNDIFNFILVMVSLVLAIGLTHLVQGIADVIRNRDASPLEALVLTWSASLFLVAAIYWWSLWDLRKADWNFYEFFYLLLAPTLFHIAVSLLVSRRKAAAEAAHRLRYDAVRVPFMATMAAFSFLVTWDGWIVGAEPLWTNYRPIQLWTVVLYLSGIVFDARRAQHVIAALVLVTYVAAGFFFRFAPGAFGS